MSRKSPLALLVLVLFLLVIIAILYILLIKPFPSQQAKAVVHMFYSNEQIGNYSTSWDLFHSKMQKKFSKVNYVQERADILISKFGVTTFSYDLSRASKEENWSMADGIEPFPVVYKVTVTQSFNSKYGNFQWVQDVFLAEEDGAWKILWDYKIDSG